MRIAILSLAHFHGYSYAAAVVKHPAAELALIWDEDAARGAAAAKQFGCAFEPDLDRALAANIDAVIITSANVHHKEIAVKAARAGKHILCEKPMAINLEDALAVEKAVRYFLLGSVIVLPIWLVVRLFKFAGRDETDLAETRPKDRPLVVGARIDPAQYRAQF